MVQKALEDGYNIRRVDADHAAISLDETATCADIAALASALAGAETSATCRLRRSCLGSRPHAPDAFLHGKGFQLLPFRNGNDALHPPPGIPGPGSK